MISSKKEVYAGKKEFYVNGKITYPQGEGNLTTFTFTNKETGDMFSISTRVDAEAATIDYGQDVTIEILPKQ